MRMRAHNDYIYGVPGVLNIRDMGGYETKDGKITAKGRFIRSAGLARLDDGEAIRELGVDCVVDLRSVPERLRAPDIAEDMESVRYEHVPMLDYIAATFDSRDFGNFPASMAELYIGLLKNSGGGYKRIFEIFADERNNCCLFHCTAGKDRTGVTAMLLLGLAGVSDDDIVSDYSLTDMLLTGSRLSRVEPGIPEYVVYAAEETMRETLGFLHKTYGGAAKYLESVGVGEESRAAILSKLLSSDSNSNIFI